MMIQSIDLNPQRKLTNFTTNSISKILVTAIYVNITKSTTYSSNCF